MLEELLRVTDRARTDAGPGQKSMDVPAQNGQTHIGGASNGNRDQDEVSPAI